MSNDPPPPPPMSAEDWNKRYASMPSLWQHSPNAALVEFASTLQPGRALDMGAGEGRNGVWLATQGWETTALDLSDVALARAAERAQDEGVPLRCIVGDWREHDFEPESFDLVVVAYMHPNDEERLPMYGRAARALVPGGHLFVTGVHATDYGRRGPPDRSRLHTAERLREALEPSFEVLRCETISYERKRSGEIETVTDVVGIGRRLAG